MSKFTESQQWKSGTDVANWLDAFFRARAWTITPTTPHEERVLRLGDRHYNKPNRHYFVEYKSGIQTAATGNVFIETISVDSQSKPGWVYTCRADFIFYATLLNGFILVMGPEHLRQSIEKLREQFKEVKTGKGQNDGYNTHGLIVPLEYAKQYLTKQIIPIGGKL